MQTNIAADYLGLRLNSPIVVGSCPMTLNPEKVRELTTAGAGAFVLPSLLEEQIVYELGYEGTSSHLSELGTTAISSDNSGKQYNGGPQDYLAKIRTLKSTAAIPLIASLNGSAGGEWLTFASRIQDAGADGLEVVFDSATPAPLKSADEIEKQLIDSVHELCSRVSIPVAIKLSPFHTNLANLSCRLAKAGVSGIVCFAHETNWRVATDTIATSLEWTLTPASSVNQTISGLIRVRRGEPAISLAASGGISSSEDIIQAVIAGADVVMLTSEIYRSGPSVIAHLVEGISNYLNLHQLRSFDDLLKNRPPPTESPRSDFLDCLTASRGCFDPTPTAGRRQGDRWGHVQ